MRKQLNLEVLDANGEKVDSLCREAISPEMAMGILPFLDVNWSLTMSVVAAELNPSKKV